MKRKNSTNGDFKKTLAVFGVVLTAVILLCVGIVVMQPDCSEPPTVPEYPNATIVQTGISRGSYPRVAGYTYETMDSYEDILAFYSAQMQCGDIANRTICEVKPVHYMEYFVYLDRNTESPYRYMLEVHWNTHCQDVSTPYNDIFG